MGKNNVSAIAIKSLLKLSSKVKVFGSIDSTNSMAKLDATNGAGEGDLIVALSQTGGRGRMGRSFYSPEESGIYFSIILRPKIKAEDISLITPVAAVAVAAAAEKITKKSPKIKWVNDIFLNGKKICGILSEAAFNADGTADYVVLGIGINLTTPKNGYPEEIKNIAGSLFDDNESFDANALIADIVNRFFELYKDLKGEATKEEYQKRMMLIGSTVNYTQNKNEYSGTVEGIDERFRLVIKNALGEMIALESGEVTIGSGNIL